MRKLIFSVVLATVFMFGCSKEKVKEQVDFGNNSSIKLITLSGDERTSITMLECSSSATLDSIINDLQQRIETLDDSFMAQYGYLDDSLLNLKEEEIKFNYQQPLIDFENSLNFTNSMRQVFIVNEENWLNHDTLDFSTDPSNTYVFNIVEMAILNINGEVKIGDSLLKVTKDGFILITDGNINTLIRIDNGDMSALSEANVITSIEQSRSAGCSWWKGKSIEHQYQSNKKVKKEVKFHAYPWRGVSSSEITSYKKKNNGNWKKWRTSLGVANQVYYRNRDCNSFGSEWSGWKRKTRKSISKENSKWGAFPGVRAENGQSVIGYFEYPGNSNSLVLSW